MRPPGALAPTIPGYNGHYDESSLLDMYTTEEHSRSRPSQQQQVPSQSRYADAYPLANARLHPDNNTNTPLSSRVKDFQPQRSPSTDFVNRTSLTRIPEPAALTQFRSQDTDVGVGRAISTGSTISSAQTNLLGRNLSASTTATTYSDYQASKGGSPLLSTDKLVGSYTFSAAGPSTVGYPETNDDSRNGYVIQGGSTDSFDRTRPSDFGAAGNSGGALIEQEDEDDDYFTDSDDPDPDRFVNFSLLSHLAVRLRDKVPRGTHVKSSIPYPRAFTGKDIVVCGRVLDVHCLDSDVLIVDNPITNSTRIVDKSRRLYGR